MANKQSTKQAKDNAVKQAQERISKSKRVADTVAKQKADAQAKALQLVKSGEAIETVMSGHTPSQSLDGSRFKPVAAEYGMLIKPGMEKNKPEAAEYEVTSAGVLFASAFDNDSDDKVISAINDMGNDLANMQGKLAAACAGLAAYLQRKGKDGIPRIQAFLDACEPWGKRLTMVRVEAIRLWFTEMAACDYGKSDIKGEGKTIKFNADKHKKEGSKYGLNPDAWLRRRIAKPFWLIKPEKELQEFDLMTQLKALLARATKLEEKATDPNAAGYKVINIGGLSAVKVAVNTIERELKKQANDSDNTEDTTKEQAAEEVAA